jgi:hypothetical protein
MGGVLRGVHLEAVSSGGRRDGSGDSIHWLPRNCTNVDNGVQQSLPKDGIRWEQETVDLGMMQEVVHAVLSECWIQCMLYSVYADLGVNS